MGRVVHKEIYVASIFGGVGDGKKEMLRKKTHVVRKKTHVVRKFFYVASIFGDAAGRKNRSPWKLSSTAGELSSTAGELSSTAGDFSSTASRRRQRLQCVYRAPVFLGALIQVYQTIIKKGRTAVRRGGERVCRAVVLPACEPPSGPMGWAVPAGLKKRVWRAGQPTRLPGTTGRSTVMTLRLSSKLTAERIIPWLSMPLMVRGARLATKHTCLPTSCSGS